MPKHAVTYGLVAALTLMLIGLPVLSGRAAAPGSRLTDRSPNAVPVDVELVLGVDVSYSMDPDEQALQREGYQQALTSTEFMRALREGMHAKIAITYFEWASNYDQRIVVPWRLISGPESAAAVAEEIGRASYRRASRTSISGALAFAKPLFDTSGYRGIRRVIDISGDGPNNQGALVAPTRDEVVAAGITINGLPIVLKRSRWSMMDIENLDVYYEDCVIGGPGAFVVPILDRAKFKEAIRHKLVQEVAGLMPQPKVIRVADDKPRVDCTIGEKLWQQRWGN